MSTADREEVCSSTPSDDEGRDPDSDHSDHGASRKRVTPSPCSNHDEHQPKRPRNGDDHAELMLEATTQMSDDDQAIPEGLLAVSEQSSLQAVVASNLYGPGDGQRTSLSQSRLSINEKRQITCRRSVSDDSATPRPTRVPIRAGRRSGLPKRAPKGQQLLLKFIQRQPSTDEGHQRQAQGGAGASSDNRHQMHARVDAGACNILDQHIDPDTAECSGETKPAANTKAESNRYDMPSASFKVKLTRRRRCGECQSCLKPDCGLCKNCV